METGRFVRPFLQHLFPQTFPPHCAMQACANSFDADLGPNGVLNFGRLFTGHHCWRRQRNVCSRQESGKRGIISHGTFEGLQNKFIRAESVSHRAKMHPNSWQTQDNSRDKNAFWPTEPPFHLNSNKMGVSAWLLIVWTHSMLGRPFNCRLWKKGHWKHFFQKTLEMPLKKLALFWLKLLS